MNIKLFTIICTALVLSSCTDISVKRIAVDNAQMLVAEQVRVNEIFSPNFISLKKDFLIITSSLSDTMLFAYSLPSLAFHHSFGTKGQGPDEIQYFPMFCESSQSKYLYIWGYTPLTIKKMLIDDGRFILKDEHKLEQYEAFNCMHIVDDSLFIYYLPDELTVKKYDLKAKKYLDKITLKKDDHPESYYYSNRGLIAVNDSFLIYSYLFKKQIDIYDLYTFQKKTVISDGKKYAAPDWRSPDPVMYHRNIYAGTHCFYVLCNENQEQNVQSSDNYSLKIFDYAGNSIAKYTFDKVPFLFVVDEENGYIYGYNSEYEDYLLKYKIPENGMIKRQ